MQVTRNKEIRRPVMSGRGAGFGAGEVRLDRKGKNSPGGQPRERWTQICAGIGPSRHEVKRIGPRYVTPFVRSQQNDAADAQVIVEVT